MPPEPKLGILAGGGGLPPRIIQACKDSGRQYFVIAFEDQTPPETVDGEPHAWVRLGAAGKAIELLRSAGVGDLVFAGSINRPSMSSLMPDMWAARFFARSGAHAMGDDGLLSALVARLEEKEGFRVVGPDSLIPELLAPKGVYGAVRPDSQALEDIQLGIEAALDIGARDLGQAAVAHGGKVLAVEGAEGTDAMLASIDAARQSGRGGVLVKISKPGQEVRADLPTVGTSTIEAAAAANIGGVAVEAGGALVMDMAEVVKAADMAGLFVIGVAVADRQPAREEK
ncbi:MAG: UDP-2,3-diacylglucosamine diphosphatase LpxI [Rhodospirillales bacterium]